MLASTCRVGLGSVVEQIGFERGDHFRKSDHLVAAGLQERLPASHVCRQAANVSTYTVGQPVSSSDTESDGAVAFARHLFRNDENTQRCAWAVRPGVRSRHNDALYRPLDPDSVEGTGLAQLSPIRGCNDSRLDDE